MKRFLHTKKLITMRLHIYTQTVRFESDMVIEQKNHPVFLRIKLKRRICIDELPFLK